MTPPMKITPEVLAVGKAMMRTLAERHKLAAVMSLTPDDVDAISIAALEAIEQPSEGMIQAGRQVICDAVSNGRMTRTAAISDWRTKNRMRWQAMIRAALGRE